MKLPTKSLAHSSLTVSCTLVTQVWVYFNRVCIRKLSRVIYLKIIPWARVGYELAITNLISNKREWNNCFIKFSAFGYCCWSLLNFILSKNLFQIKRQLPTKARETSDDHMTSAALCKQSWMKNRKRKRSDIVRHIKFKKLLNVRVTTFLRQAFKMLLKFQLIEKLNSCAHLSKCFAVWCRAKEGIKGGFLILNWIPRRRFKTLQASPSVRGTTSLRQTFSASF